MPDLIKEVIEARAQRLGFSFAGFAPVSQTPHFPKYEEQIIAQDIPDLVYLKKPYILEARRDPASLMPGAKTVIVLGVIYPLPDFGHSGETQGSGTIASYAILPDYHKVVKEKARSVIAELNQISRRDISARIFVDSGPLMEKDMGFSACLTWIGKNTLAIHPKHGSAFLICCILVDLEIPTGNEQVPDLCGDCRKCISACPTACIGDYALDIGRCVSYLTIEYKGVIPRDLREKVGMHIFGCDTCQDVCPINKTTPASPNEYFFGLRSAIPREVDLTEELALNPQAFTEKYSGTVVMRTGFEHHLRNVAIVAGNSANPALIPQLKNLFGLNNEIISVHAVWALGQYQHKDVYDFLGNQLNSSTSSQVIEEINWVLQTNR